MSRCSFPPWPPPSSRSNDSSRYRFSIVERMPATGFQVESSSRLEEWRTSSPAPSDRRPFRRIPSAEGSITGFPSRSTEYRGIPFATSKVTRMRWFGLLTVCDGAAPAESDEAATRTTPIGRAWTRADMAWTPPPTGCAGVSHASSNAQLTGSVDTPARRPYSQRVARGPGSAGGSGERLPEPGAEGARIGAGHRGPACGHGHGRGRQRARGPATGPALHGSAPQPVERPRERASALRRPPRAASSPTSGCCSARSTGTGSRPCARTRGSSRSAGRPPSARSGRRGSRRRSSTGRAPGGSRGSGRPCSGTRD